MDSLENKDIHRRSPRLLQHHGQTPEEASEAAPRRSLRLSKIREKTPEVPSEVQESKKVRGPRSMAKLKKILNQTAPETKSETESSNPMSSVEANEVCTEKPIPSIEIQSPGLAQSNEQNDIPVKLMVDNQADKDEEKVMNTADKTWEPQEPHSVAETSSGMSADKFASGPVQEVSNPDSFLMDESIILVPDSPEPTCNRKDSTFSPIVDSSIHDSRPNIDVLAIKTVSLRTSTPLVHQTLAREVTKFNETEVSTQVRLEPAMKDLPTTSKALELVAQEVSKPVSMLEKSILKSSRRKRSMSVADGESFLQKRVMFNSPQVMEINAIDEKMIASFIEEKENSVMLQPQAYLGRRKRSLSTGTPIKGKAPSRVKVPNFRAIHEQQFQKMESIADHALRKAERAKKLATPTRNTEAVPSKLQQLSKIPTILSRKPLASGSSKENLIQPKVTPNRLLKRSMSATEEEPPRKRTQAVAVSVLPKAIPEASDEPAKKIAVVRALQRSYSESAKSNMPSSMPWNVPSTNFFTMGIKKTPTKPKSGLNATQSRAKIEERREKNFSLYKTNQTQRTTVDQRSKNANILKGVRLNRRFELQMQHRRNMDENTED